MRYFMQWHIQSTSDTVALHLTLSISLIHGDGSLWRWDNIRNKFSYQESFKLLWQVFFVLGPNSSLHHAVTAAQPKHCTVFFSRHMIWIALDKTGSQPKPPAENKQTQNLLYRTPPLLLNKCVNFQTKCAFFSVRFCPFYQHVKLTEREPPLYQLSTRSNPVALQQAV